MKRFLLSVIAGASLLSASAADFFSTDPADKLITYGSRIGLNTSNRSISKDDFQPNQMSWGLGFDLGAVVNFNFLNSVSLQPGLFFETRSGSYSLKSKPFDDPTHLIVDGKGTTYNFTIPVMVVIHFNIVDALRWNVEAGPYVQFNLGSTFNNKFSWLTADDQGALYYQKVKTASCDVGLKIGTSFDIFQHYYIGIHYLGGGLHAWNPGQLGGHNKAWNFTIGYNF